MGKFTLNPVEPDVENTTLDVDTAWKTTELYTVVWITLAMKITARSHAVRPSDW